MSRQRASLRAEAADAPRQEFAATIAANLRRLRQARGMSQRTLASRVGLSHGSYKRIERGEAASLTGPLLLEIAAALGVRSSDLLRPVQELEAVRFRSRQRLRLRQQILAEVARRLEDYRSLEDVLDDHIPYALAHMDLGSFSSEAVSKAAEAVRVELARVADPVQAGSLEQGGPILDIVALLESAGIKVLRLPTASDRFFGLSVGAEDGGPAIVINTWSRIPVERWIFTAAHELGHLVLHPHAYDADVAEEPPDEEAQADRFAAEFLMPEDSFWSLWEQTAGLAFVDRVLMIKRVFRVSYRTVLYRLHQRFGGDVRVWARFHQQFYEATGRRLRGHVEPDPVGPEEFRVVEPPRQPGGEPERLAAVDVGSDRLERLVRRALEAQHITLSRAAEILGMSTSEVRTLAARWI